MPRIIAGRFGGRTLQAPDGRGTRPTSDRVREALFSRLQHLGVLEGARVLDLFAGSGALGLEALSRGAGGVVLVDSHRRAADVCRRNAAAVKAGDAVNVYQRAASAYLAGPARPFDLVLLDPPYELAEDELGALLARIEGWLDERAVVVVERSSRSPEPGWPSGLSRFDERSYGETRLWFAEPGRAYGP